MRICYICKKPRKSTTRIYQFTAFGIPAIFSTACFIEKTFQALEKHSDINPTKAVVYQSAGNNETSTAVMLLCLDNCSCHLCSLSVQTVLSTHSHTAEHSYVCPQVQSLSLACYCYSEIYSVQHIDVNVILCTWCDISFPVSSCLHTQHWMNSVYWLSLPPP